MKQNIYNNMRVNQLESDDTSMWEKELRKESELHEFFEDKREYLVEIIQTEYSIDPGDIGAVELIKVKSDEPAIEVRGLSDRELQAWQCTSTFAKREQEAKTEIAMLKERLAAKTKVADWLAKRIIVMDAGEDRIKSLCYDDELVTDIEAYLPRDEDTAIRFWLDLADRENGENDIRLGMNALAPSTAG